MLIFKEVNALRKYLSEVKKEGKSIGFVPTMGALHAGHLSLVKASNRDNDITVSSIFVNPAQFNQQSDFDAYPNQIEQDVAKLESEQCSVLFLPKVDEIYPDDSYEKPVFEFNGLDNLMEGEFRPGHFEGVGQVIKRFLEIIICDRMYLGEKDYQQVQIIKRVVDQFGYNVEVVPVPTERENGGLAMSSRNLLLSPEARSEASIIYKSLSLIKEQFDFDHIDEMLTQATDRINEAEHLEVEYLTAVDAETLQVLDPKKRSSVVVCTAVWANGVRLIDNIVIED
jgi:pantoate--beta-alanine ligase